MAQFNIDAHLSSGQKLEWLASPGKGESVQQVVSQVRQAAIEKFGKAALFKRWRHVVSSNGYVTVQMLD